MRNSFLHDRNAGTQAPPRHKVASLALYSHTAPALVSTVQVATAAPGNAATPSAWRTLLEILAALAAATGGHNVY